MANETEQRHPPWTAASVNFAAASAVVALCGSAGGITLLYGYLSAFSPSIIQYIDYSDVIKSSFLLVTIFLSAGVFVSNIYHITYSSLRIDGIRRFRFYFIFYILSLCVISLIGWSEYVVNNNVEMSIAIWFAISIIFIISIRFRFYVQQNSSDLKLLDGSFIGHIFLDIFLVFLSIYSIGFAYGVSVKEWKFEKFIITVGSKQFYGSTVIFAGGSYFIFSVDNEINVLPSRSIEQINIVPDSHLLSR